MDYLLKWTRIADYFLYDSRIFFGLYTKSFPFFIGLDLPRNMTPSASLWDDTPEEQKALVADLVKNGWQAYCYKPHKGTETVVEIH